MERITLTLRGADGRERTFVAAQDTTVGHEVWMMRLVRSAGLYGVNLTQPEAVLERALESGRTIELLAGSLVEPGVPFSEAAMAERAAWIEAITDAESRRQIRDALVMLLLSFFLSGTASSPTSPSSSLAPETPSPRDDAGGSAPAPTVPTSEREATWPETPDPATSSVSGAASSASSPAATLSG